jgi:23S rRNA pseudouridine1911/1915/1917 synthase
MPAFEVSDADDGARLDQWLAHALGCSRREAQRLIAEGAVRVDGAVARKGGRLHRGARVRVEHGAPSTDDRRPLAEPDAPLDVVYVDDTIVAMVKPPGIPTHPLRPGERGTLANALVARYPECAHVSDDSREGGVTHRLDRDTSGLVLAARTRAAWLALRHSFADGAVAKEYLALVAGQPPDRGVVDAPLVHVGKRVRVARARDLDAQRASTAYEVLARGDGTALVRATTSSGRMHQVRVHLQHAGHPIVGDALYAGPPPAPGTHGHFLHASAATFPHPRDGRPTTLQAPLPADRASALAALVNWPQPSHG